MIRQRLSHQLILILWILMLVGCAAPATPVPLTPTITATGPVLTDGADQWQLSSVTFQDTFDNDGKTVAPLDKSQTLLRVDFECTSGASLINLYLDYDIQVSSFAAPGGIPDVYLTDDAGAKYSVVLIKECSLIAPVSKNSSGFTLYFKDLQSIELGK